MATSSTVQMKVIKDFYPVSTSVRKAIDWEPCHFQIIGVRDLASHPLSVEDFLRRPMLRRSRFALRVEDLATGQTRMIYQRLLKADFRECPLRIGIFHGSDLEDLLRTNYGPTATDRIRMVRFLQNHRDNDMGDFRLAVLSDDCESITCATPDFVGNVTA